MLKALNFTLFIYHRNSINPDSNFATLQLIFSSKNQSVDIVRNIEEKFYRIL